MKNKHTQGFTIVELLIIVVVIAILATLVLVGFSGMQAKARDAERKSDIKSVAKFLETYYIDNGAYPPFVNAGAGMSIASWRSSAFPNLSNDALIPPGLSSIVLVNSATPAIGEYGYHNNGTCVAMKCTAYRLYWRSEAGNTVQTVTSLN
jgi:type II secretory pathway pseudopilin PulG